MSKQNQNVKREMQPKNMAELQPTGRSKLCTHDDNVALGNKSTRAAGIHDDFSTLGRRWASHGGGGESRVDALGSNFKLFERSEVLIDTSQKKSLRVCRVHACTRVRLLLVLVLGRQIVYGQNTVYLCLSKYIVFENTPILTRTLQL